MAELTKDDLTPAPINPEVHMPPMQMIKVDVIGHRKEGGQNAVQELTLRLPQIATNFESAASLQIWSAIREQGGLATYEGGEYQFYPIHLFDKMSLVFHKIVTGVILP